MTIDWNATGSMLQGWATLVGAGVVIYAARVGANTFTAWKRQKVEERRMDAAERILTLAYRLRYNFADVRRRGIFGYETAAAEQKLDGAMPEWRNREKSEQERLTTAQTILNRLTGHRADWEQAWELKPVALALFGPEVEADLHRFWEQYVAIEVSAATYAEDSGADRKFSISLRRELFGGEGDKVAPAVDAAIASLEARLLPVLRS